jgi:tetratricopeptide (TPR) repeat protein
VTALLPLFLTAGLAVRAAEPSLAEGFDHFYNLEYDQASVVFNAEAAAHPDNPKAYNHVAQTILYRAMFRAGALESELVTGTNPFLRRAKVNPGPEEQQRFDQAIQKSMDICQARLQKNPADKDAMYTLGVAHGLRANYNFMVRKAYMDSLKDVTAARKLHSKVIEMDPNYTDARLVEGVHDYVVGSLPFTYKMFGFLVGFRGDKEGGVRELELVAKKGDLNKVDAEILLAAVYRRERRAKEAVPLLKDLIRRFPRNYLLRFEQVQMFADLGDKESALAELVEIEKLKRSNVAGFTNLPWEKIFYSRGNLLFWYREYDRAVEDLQKVTVKASDVDLNTGTFAWLRLGQSLDMKGSRGQAVQAYRQAIALAPESDAAKESKRYLSSPYQRKS